MFTLACPVCGDSRNVQVTAALPLRAWVHCGSCNHLWRESGIGLLCRWIVGANDGTPHAAPASDPASDLPSTLPAINGAPLDPALEQWLAQGADERSHASNGSLADWLDTNPFEERTPGTPVVDDGYFVPPPEPAPMATPRTLGERLDTFYDGLVRLEEFVKRCARQEETIADAVAQANAGAAEMASAGANTPAPHRASVLPFQRLAG